MDSYFVPEVKVTTEEVVETRLKQIVSEVVSEMKDPTPKPSYLEMLSKGKTSSISAPGCQLSMKKLLTPSLTKTATKTICAPKRIYGVGLPPNTIINDLIDAVKKFGRVRKVEGVQVIVFEDQYCYGFVHFKSAKKAIEAQAITIKGKAANISYKRFGRNARASTDDNDNRGRSPSGRGISHNKAPSCNGHSSNCETRHSDANQHNNNKTCFLSLPTVAASSLTSERRQQPSLDLEKVAAMSLTAKVSRLE
nr:putative G3BP-like protein [Ipomoea trifida]